MEKKRAARSKKTVYVIAGVWALLLAGGLTGMLAYETNQPTLPSVRQHIQDPALPDLAIPSLIPRVVPQLADTGFAGQGVSQETVSEPAHSRPSAFFFFHPNCPCTAATIAELEALLPAVSGGDPKSRPLLYGVVYSPKDSDSSWTDTPSIRQARAIDGLTLIDDPDAAIAKGFGAAVSGQVLLYDAHGDLVFNGGVTESRGQQGENLGLDQLRAFLEGKKPSLSSFPVLGCLLYQI